MYYRKHIQSLTKSISLTTIKISFFIAITLLACTNNGNGNGDKDNDKTISYILLSGLVVAATTSVIIPGATLVLGYIPIIAMSVPPPLESACDQLTTIAKSTLSDENGYYQFKINDELINKKLLLKVTKDNEFLPACYIIEPVSPNLSQLNDKEIKLALETIELININQVGIGSISGTVFNALDGTPVENAIVRVRKDINQHQGIAIEAKQQTTALGDYEIVALETGNYTLEASREGFITSYATTIALNELNPVSDQNITITPFQKEGEVLIVLTWDSNNKIYLDPHLTGPRELPLSEIPEQGTQERFHIFEAQGGLGNSDQAPFAELTSIRNNDDGDPSNAHPLLGPSTIIVTRQLPGEYFYYVYDRTNRENPSSTQLATISKAQVRVFRDNQLVITFNVPVNEGISENEGNLWKVFRMNGNTITPINHIIFEPNEENVDQQDNILLDLFPK